MQNQCIEPISFYVEERTYKRIGNIELNLKIYKPSDWRSDDKRTAIIFFFGGGWVNGTLDHFKLQSEHFASRGMVVITPEYRIKSKHDTTPFESVADGHSAIGWVKEHIAELGIDEEKIAVAGGSAGGHIAVCSVLIAPFDRSLDGVNNIPKAMVLFNPVVDTTESGFGYDKLGERGLELSPVHHVRPNMPPTILFHGTGDKTVPYENAVRFCEVMVNNGNECTLISYEGQPHGFFNFGFGDSKDSFHYYDTLKKADDFLVSMGYII